MNIGAYLNQRFKDLWSQFIFRAVVTGTSGNKVFIQRTGQAAPDGQAYPRLVSYAGPAAADEVIVVWVGGFIVIGKVTR